ncbi:MAG: hypothetical protein HYV40_03675 [Candidatus Levybacteria bacterium]|nr:hypothetical protein [Candidatus Levybacteria bacterium]
MKTRLVIAYGVFLIGVLVSSYCFVDPNLQYLQWFYLHFSLRSQPGKIALLLIILVIFFTFYILILRLYQRKILKQKDGIRLITMTVLCLLFSYPAVYSYDIFNYVATAKVAFLYGENPYIVMPIEFTGEPILSFMHAPNKVALYGPGWIILTLLPFIVGGGNFVLTLFSFKAFIIVFYCLLLYLLYKLSKNFFAVLFFGLNPLVVIETIIGGHNDVVMMAFLFIGIYLYLRKNRSFGVIFYICSVITKYATLILLPVFLLLKYTHRREIITQTQLLRWSMYGMIIIFLMSSFREEIYPWYAIWFLPFVALVGSRNEKLLAIVFTFCLELRYFPYMIFLTHFGITPLLKTIITFVPLIVLVVLLFINRVWGKTSLHYLR